MTQSREVAETRKDDPSFDMIDTPNNETLSEVTRLIEILDGVDVIWTRSSESGIDIGVCANDQSSLAALNYVTSHANVRMTVELNWNAYWPWDGSQTDPACLAYNLHVVNSGNLVSIGHELLRHFKKKDLMEAKEIDRLLTKWNCWLP